jgi:hypothetical protein
MKSVNLAHDPFGIRIYSTFTPATDTMQFTNALLAATPDETAKVVTAWPINSNNALLVVVGCIFCGPSLAKRVRTHQKKSSGPKMLIRDSWPPQLQELSFTL